MEKKELFDLDLHLQQVQSNVVQPLTGSGYCNTVFDGSCATCYRSGNVCSQ